MDPQTIIVLYAAGAFKKKAEGWQPPAYCEGKTLDACTALITEHNNNIDCAVFFVMSVIVVLLAVQVCATMYVRSK